MPKQYMSGCDNLGYTRTISSVYGQNEYPAVSMHGLITLTENVQSESQ